LNPARTLSPTQHGDNLSSFILRARKAINYAQNSASFRLGEIQILDSSGNVESTIPFNEANRLPVVWSRGVAVGAFAVLARRAIHNVDLRRRSQPLAALIRRFAL